MAFLLRVVRKAKWYKHPSLDWLQDGELQADALSDLVTSNNELSVWYVEENRANLERLLAAVAASRTNIGNLDFAIFEEAMLPRIGAVAHVSQGNLPDSGANNWHRDLVELSATKLFELAKLIQNTGAIQRLIPKQVRTLVSRGIAAQQIDPSKLKPEILSKLD